jgi:hypothetical protein
LAAADRTVDLAVASLVTEWESRPQLDFERLRALRPRRAAAAAEESIQDHVVEQNSADDFAVVPRRLRVRGRSG